ncbi:hypothetical protein GCM10023063_08020 [Arthrobacter methylotrophus]|uniref:SGNH hydrolase-type esterase domain-containing protein n=1 Tax=Arthrobacter methylotrophus TaxID=121291 RepID=A0ABV5UWZ2_9MICC
MAGSPRVIVLGRMWAKDGAEHLPALRDLTARVCADLGIVFIDSLGWLSPRLIGPDGGHPIWLGHTVIAVRIARAIRGLQLGQTSARRRQNRYR